jgi:hydroxymethylbilane synthase
VRLRIGTRGSALALRQTDIAIEALRAVRPDLEADVVEISTKGDVDKTTPFSKLGTKGIFAHELQAALLDGRIDVAVHSLKDLQAKEPDGLVIAATPPREDARDVLVSRGGVALAELEPGAVVGTSSVRREALVRSVRPDLRCVPLRGNVDTRLRKVREGEVGAAVLAAAGIVRLGRADEITEWLDPSVFVPPPGQGALALECRAVRFADDLAWVAGAEDTDTRRCVDAERAVMLVIEGSCEVPLGAYAVIEDGEVVCTALVSSKDGTKQVRDRERGRDPVAVGTQLARRLLASGGAALVATS